MFGYAWLFTCSDRRSFRDVGNASGGIPSHFFFHRSSSAVKVHSSGRSDVNASCKSVMAVSVSLLILIGISSNACTAFFDIELKRALSSPIRESRNGIKTDLLQYSSGVAAGTLLRSVCLPTCLGTTGAGPWSSVISATILNMGRNFPSACSRLSSRSETVLAISL